MESKNTSDFMLLSKVCFSAKRFSPDSSDVQHKAVEICHVGSHPYQTRNMVSTCRKLCMPLSNVLLSLETIFTKHNFDFMKIGHIV